MKKATVTLKDVRRVAQDLKINATSKQMREVLKDYPDAQKDAPIDHWSQVIENLLYSITKGKALFVTVDGVQMYEGELYYAVDPKTGKFVWSIADNGSLESDWKKYSLDYVIKHCKIPEVKRNERGITVDQLVKIWDECYWENFKKEYKGAYQRLKELTHREESDNSIAMGVDSKARAIANILPYFGIERRQLIHAQRFDNIYFHKKGDDVTTMSLGEYNVKTKILVINKKRKVSERRITSEQAVELLRRGKAIRVQNWGSDDGEYSALTMEDFGRKTVKQCIEDLSGYVIQYWDGE